MRFAILIVLLSFLISLVLLLFVLLLFPILCGIGTYTPDYDRSQMPYLEFMEHPPKTMKGLYGSTDDPIEIIKFQISLSKYKNPSKITEEVLADIIKTAESLLWVVAERGSNYLLLRKNVQSVKIVFHTKTKWVYVAWCYGLPAEVEERLWKKLDSFLPKD